MNADKMTREEFHGRFLAYQEAWKLGDSIECERIRLDLWYRIDAIQNRPFQPDWDNRPEGVIGFRGSWVGPWSCENAPGEFYIPAPSNPTDAELVAMWEKLDRDKRVQILRDAGVVV